MEEQVYRPNESDVRRLIAGGEARDWLDAAEILAVREGLAGLVILLGPDGEQRSEVVIDRDRDPD